MTTSNRLSRGAGLHPTEGCVLYVKDSSWGFFAVGRVDHPGIILWLSDDERYCTLIKGTDAEHVRDRATSHIISPNEANGLIKPTAFRLEPRVLPRRLVMLMLDSPRWIGRIEERELESIRLRLAHSFGGTEWPR